MDAREASIGEVLAAARDGRGLSVEDVAAATRIRATLIRDIEVDRFDTSGGMVYARGHVRSIAGVVGADQAVLMAEFDRAYGAVVPDPTPVPEFAPDVARAERRAPNWSAAMAFAVAVVAVIAGVAYFRPSSGPASGTRAGDGTPAAATSSRPSPPGPTPAASKSPAHLSLPPNTVAQLPHDGVHVVVRVTTSKSWLHVSNARGGDLFTGVLAAGTTREFTDGQQIRMTIGYPPAVDLVVNGQDVGVTGGPDEVTHVAFGPDDPVGGAG